jgi:hypothetical protein
MKKILQWLTLVVCLLAFASPQAQALDNPGSTYIVWGKKSDKSDWSYNNSMTKSSDGNKYSYTISNLSNEDVYFKVHKNSGYQAENSNVYFDGTYNATNDITGKTSFQVYLYDSAPGCMLIKSVTGTLTITLDFSTAKMSYSIEEPTYYYYFKGNLKDSSWTEYQLEKVSDGNYTISFDSPFENGTEFGFKRCLKADGSDEDAWFNSADATDYTPSADGTTYTLQTKGSNFNFSNLKSWTGTLKFDVTVDEDAHTMTALKVTGCYTPQDTYSYSLYDGDEKLSTTSATDGKVSFKYSLTSSLTDTMNLWIRATKTSGTDKTNTTDTDYGIGGDAYNGTTKSDVELVADQAITLAQYLKGDVTFDVTVGDDNVPSKVTISGGYLAETKDYTVYFFSKAGNVADDGSVYAYMYNGNQHFEAWNDMSKMEATGKYVIVDNQFYKVWKFTASTDIAPNVVIFTWDADGKTKSAQTVKYNLVDGNFYTDEKIGSSGDKSDPIDSSYGGLTQVASRTYSLQSSLNWEDLEQFFNYNSETKTLTYSYTFTEDNPSNGFQFGVYDKECEAVNGNQTFVSGDAVNRSYTPSTEGTTFTSFQLAGNGGTNFCFVDGIFGTVTFSMNINDDATIKDLTISGGQLPSYKLHTNLGTDAEYQDIDLTSANNYSYTHTFNGTESGKFVGMMVNGSWRGAKNASAYNGTETVYDMSLDQDGNITFKSGLTGDVTFTYNTTAKTLTVTGGKIPVADLVLSGSFNQNATNDETYKMTQSDNVYTYTFANKVEAGTTFRIKTAEDNDDTVWGAEAASSSDAFSVTQSDASEGTFLEAYTIKVTRDGKDATFDATFPGNYTGLGAKAYVFVNDGAGNIAREFGGIDKDGDGHFSGTLTGVISDENADFKFRMKIEAPAVTITSIITVPVAGAASSDPVNVTFNTDMTAVLGSAAAFKFAANAENVVVTFDRTAQTVKVTGDEEKEYTIYYYNTSITSDEAAKAKNVCAYVWQEKGVEVTSWDDRKAMTPLSVDKRYVFIDNKYYPVYAYTFKWTKTPKYVIFTVDGKKAPEKDLGFTADGVYNGSGLSSSSKYDFVATGEGVVPALYFHVKYDFENLAKSGASLRCHIYNDNGASPTTWNTDAENMVCVSEKYSIWKYEIPNANVSDYNAAVFYFDTADGGMAKYHTDRYDENGNYKISFYDSANWANYIYATATTDNSEKYAAQSYLSYEDFKALDELDTKNGGRRYLYLLGWKGMKYSDSYASDATFTDFSSSFSEAKKLTNDGGCFYLPVKATEQKSHFKVSWIDAYAAETNYKGTAGTNNSARGWATYDLGLIGVDKDFSVQTSEGEWKPSISTDDNEVYFSGNKSVQYMNYNQYDWVVDGTELKDTYYLIIDTHSKDNSSEFKGKTITLASFNPQPSVSVAYSNIENKEIDSNDATINGSFYAAAQNGDVAITTVNTAKGSATVKGSGISELNGAGFTRTYMVYVNGTKTMTIENGTGSETVEISNMPLGSASDISIRCLFTDTKTGLTFLSRTGECTITSSDGVELAKPTALSGLETKYIKEDEEGLVYGAYIKGFKINIPTVSLSDNNSLSCYADFRFYDADGNDYDAEVLTKDSAIRKIWENLAVCGDFTNWNDYIQNPGENQEVYVLVHNVLTLNKSTDDLTDKAINYDLIAVYPFLYDTSASSNSSSSQSVRRRADSLSDNMAITLETQTVTSSVTASKDKVVSGVESVAADQDLNAPVEYYTISGIRVVGTPAPGIYIRRQGNTVSKVAIR